MKRILIIEKCDDCPIRVAKESHGPCDSSYWTECGITGKTINNAEGRGSVCEWKYKDKLNFPPSCPLKETK